MTNDNTNNNNTTTSYATQDNKLECDMVIFKQPTLDCSVFVTNVPISVAEEELFKVYIIIIH